MINFSKYLKESEQVFDRTVALVGGSFKPPHAGHWHMVEEYAKKVDEVIVLISDPKSQSSIRKTKFGTVITPQMAKSIFDVFVKRYNLQNKVKVEVSPDPSPIGSLYKYIDTELKDVNVIFGVSTKGDDYKRFLSAPKYYAENEHIHVMDPKENAVKPFSNGGVAISATDIRNNIDDPKLIKSMLPAKLTDKDIQKIMEILIVNDENQDEVYSSRIDLSDKALKEASIYAYDTGMQSKDRHDKPIPINPKKFPDKVINITIPAGNGKVDVFLSSKTKKWSGEYSIDGKTGTVSEEKLRQLFATKAYGAIVKKIKNDWPLSDKKYNEWYKAIVDAMSSTLSECDGPSAAPPPGATSAGDILGKDCDHQKNGYFGKDCNHIPKPVFKKPMSRYDLDRGPLRKKKHPAQGRYEQGKY